MTSRACQAIDQKPVMSSITNRASIKVSEPTRWAGRALIARARPPSTSTSEKPSSSPNSEKTKSNGVISAPSPQPCLSPRLLRIPRQRIDQRAPQFRDRLRRNRPKHARKIGTEIVGRIAVLPKYIMVEHGLPCRPLMRRQRPEAEQRVKQRSTRRSAILARFIPPVIDQHVERIERFHMMEP